MTSKAQRPDTYRYSVRTLLAFGYLWVVMQSGFVIALAITVIQYARQPDTSIALPAMFGIFNVFWVGIALIWIRDRPTLKLSEAGLRVSQFGSRNFPLKWCEIRSVEDIRRFNVQAGRPLRFFQICWVGGVIRFNQFYTQLPRLIARLNDEIRAHNIPVVIRNYEPHLLREAIDAANSPTEKKLLRDRGLITDTKSLELEYIPPMFHSGNWPLW